MNTDTRLFEIIKKITGRTVVIDKTDGPYQTSDKIVVSINNNQIIFDAFHELCHWLSATDEERQMDNLGFGNEDNYGHEVKADNQRLSYFLIMEERAGIVQKHLVVSSKRLLAYLLSSMSTTEEQLLDYLDYFCGISCSSVDIRENTTNQAMANLHHVEVTKTLNIVEELENALA